MTKSSAAPRLIRTCRDVLLLRVSRDRLLAVSCDAAGGIGSKPHDKVRAHPRLLGKMTARVALMELLAVGAAPVALAGTLSVEPEPTGNEVMKGMLAEVRYAQLRNVQILSSSEKNVKVSQTGIGVTAIGFISTSNLKTGRCTPGDEIVAVGEPYVGQEVLRAEASRKIADTLDIIKVRERVFVHEIIPVGSRGILKEARTMAKNSNLSVRLLGSQRLDLKKSAGPATVILCAIREGSFRKLKALLDKPTNVIGQLCRRQS
ncbi:MAG: AIR synthase related protein [Candidatus Bathyarchaeia archaeon]